ncbi:glycoside hydrolase family 2 TIM barrel-domain containing protein [Streptomyces sp. NPDC002659]|uniref:glycoside hydrolase family 2 protein n=1 Tax=Streptomyces sp. NPDC002659 TaxID=3364656 RepID=UPI0036AA93ED
MANLSARPRPSRRLRTALLCATLAAGALSLADREADALTDTRAGQPEGRFHDVPPARFHADLSGGWRFERRDVTDGQAPGFDDSAWSHVSVPHTWNNLDAQDGGSRKETNAGGYYRGAGWYRRHYTPPVSFTGKKLWLQFDGVGTVADVWVNGTHLGRHRGSFARFRFDASGVLKPGRDNIIAVRADNSPASDIAPLTGDFPMMGGIYRKVSLLVTDPLQFRTTDYAGPGVYVRQRSVSAASASLDITSKVWNNSTDSRAVAVRVTVTDAEGGIVATATSPKDVVRSSKGVDIVQSISFDRPHLWNGTADAYLYKVSAELVDQATGTTTDVVTEPVGVRSFSIDPDRGFSLNGRHLPLRGVNAHQDRLDKGWAIGDAERIQDFDLMDEMGANALRTAHYQQDQHVYDLADRRGYIVWMEVPLVDKVTDSAAFTANAKQQMRELIRQNFNHPSVVFWGTGNEQSGDDTPTNTLLAAMADLVDIEDPDRISAYASHRSDGYKPGTHAETIAFNKYYGWYGGDLPAFGTWADNFHSRYPGRKVAVSEYGAGASPADHDENPGKPDPGSGFHPEEYQSKYHEAYWAQIETRPFLWGSFLWNMFDFASDWRDEGDLPGRNDKGLVSYDRRTRKDAFYFYKANWNNDQPTTHINSGRWTQRTKAATTVRVSSNSSRVELSLNGRSLGTMTAGPYHVFTKDVTLTVGRNTVRAVGSNGSGSTVTWTHTPPSTDRSSTRP